MPTFDTPEPIFASIDTAAGHLLIRASDRADTVVDVRPTNPAADRDVQAAKQTVVQYARGQLQVRAPKSKVRSLFSSRNMAQVDVTVDLPSGSGVDAKVWADARSEGRLGDSSFTTAAGSIQLDETGRLKLRSGAGNVSVARAVGHTDASTAAGKVRIGDVDGTVVAKTASGDVTLGDVTGDVQVKSANGDITIERALAGVQAKTAFGSIRIGEVVRGSIVAETGFGQVELGIREGTAAWLDVGSKFGSVRSDLDAADRPGPGDESVEVRAHTGYGDIAIQRSAVA